MWHGCIVPAAVAAAVLLAPTALADIPAPSSSGSTLALSFVDQSVKAKMDERDAAADFQCKQMFDCDGDRREYAKQQWANLLERGGPVRKQAQTANQPVAVVPEAHQGQ